MEKAFIYLVIAFCAGVNAITFDTSSRISNGDDANYNQFPYSVSIQRISEANTLGRGHRCGGAMITFQHVLTAASCLYNVVNGAYQPINPAEYRVFGGFSLLTGDNDQNRIRLIENVTIHPDFIQPPASLNDIGIIRLRTPFLNTTVARIPLPSPNFEPSPSAVCQIAGWGGQNTTATVSYRLRYTTKFIYNQDLCVFTYSQMPTHANVFDTMVCAASYDIVSSGCAGDEGSALVCNGGLTGILFQTNRCALSSFPELYTRVNNYTTWIRSITGGSSTIRPELTLFAVLAIITATFLNRV